MGEARRDQIGWLMGDYGNNMAYTTGFENMAKHGEVDEPFFG